MNKTVGIIVLILVILGVWWLAAGSDKTAETGPVKIGLIAPLTGELAFIGEAAKNGAELALKEINANQNLKHKYELVLEDDAFDATKSASAIRKLTSIDHVNAVISLASTGGNVVAPIAEQEKLPHIGMASDLNLAKGDYNFIHWTRPQEEVDLMISELVKKNLRKVAVVGVKQQGFQAILDDFKAKAAKASLEIVTEEIFNPGEKDFKSIITKTQKTNPDVYLIGAFSPELEILGKQMKDLKVKQPLTSIESFGLSNDPTIFEGQWFVDAAVAAGTFKDQYKAAYSKDVGPTAANAYDAVNLFVKAIEATGKTQPSGKEIIDQLAKISDYSGAFGTLSVSPEGVFISQASVKIISQGKVADLK